MNETEIKAAIAQRIYDLADAADWMHLNIEQRKQYYEIWTTDPQIGGILSQVIEPRRIRVYLKDTIMKTYARSRRPTLKSLLISMSISYKRITKEFEKPQALLCDGTQMYTLAPAKEWKIAIMSAFERSCEVRKLEKNIVFITEYTTRRFVDKEYRDMIDAAAQRLDIVVHWLTQQYFRFNEHSRGITCVNQYIKSERTASPDSMNKAQRSAQMAKVRGTGNKSTERHMESILIKSGNKGWDKHPKTILGKPDFFFPDYKLAIFVDGCFWHACPRCRRRTPKSDFWYKKLDGNRRRDNRIQRKLRQEGYHVMRVWEHELKKDFWLKRLNAMMRRIERTRK